MSDNHKSALSAERNVYTDKILTKKIGDEREALELVKLKLTSSKIYTEQIVKLMKQISLIKRNHHQQLKKVFAENDNINNIVFNNIVKETGYDIGAFTEIFSEGEFLGSNINKSIYQAILDELKTEMNHTAKFEKVLNEKFITSLDNYDSNNTQVRETWNLLEHLSTNNSDRSVWETNGPLLYQMFETTDFERLQFLKQTLMDFEVLVGQYEVALTNKNQSTYSKIDKFSVEDEINNFAAFSSSKNFKVLVKNSGNGKKQSQEYSQRQRSGSSTGSTEVRHTSSSTVLKHDLLHSNFTNSLTKGKLSNNASSNGGKKEKTKLRSKFGTLFGKKNKNKGSANNSKDDLVEKDSKSSYQQNLSRRPSNIAQVSNSITSDNKSEERDFNSNKALPKAPAAKYEKSVESAPRSQHIAESYQSSNSFNNAPSASLENTYEGASSYAESPVRVSSVQPEERIITPTPLADLAHKSPEAPKPRKSNKRVQSQLFNDLNVSTRESVYLDNKSLEPNYTGTASEYSVPNFVHPSIVEPTSNNIVNPDTTLIADERGVDFSNLVVNTSVAEVVNFIRTPTEFVGEDGEPIYKDKIDVVGEIALSLPSSLLNTDLRNEGLKLELDNSPALNIDNVIYNHELLNPSNSSESSYDITDANKLVAKSVGLLKYQVSNSNDSNDIYTPPVTLHSIWNHEDSKSSMVLSVKNNSSGPLTFQTCTISIQILDCQVTQVLSKPNGVFNKKKQKIIWRFNEDQSKLQLDPYEEKKFIVRFMTDKKGREGKSNIEFSMLGYKGASKSSGLLALNVLRPNGEKLNVNSVNSLISGKYYTI